MLGKPTRFCATVPAAKELTICITAAKRSCGAIEGIVTALSIQQGFIPPTINYRVPDEECDLDIVPNEGRYIQVDYALSNSLGFGGHNASILLKKWED